MPNKLCDPKYGFMESPEDKAALRKLAEEITQIASRDLTDKLARLCRIAIKCGFEGFLPSDIYDWYRNYLIKERGE
jgi:hypothetical protein